ncbi:hypothetical protein JF50_02845 [Pseudoalteromonas luteoviolacea]|uniref:Uncharacterized protein n=1 Tax=Pseudoalteromonas luteoviolacea TaxID=43657 RepID=A0A0C1QHG2_9GAMM|nr:hypothetical protein [Pseudoalteromonas luteoviolacea]KID58810.1 hypothetical protein JF50_02845 [Pseudoalteromonas luteoviolacea]
MINSKSPWEVVAEFFSDWNQADVAWLTLGLAIVIIIYMLNLKVRATGRKSGRTTLLYSLMICFWVYAFQTVIKEKVDFSLSVSNLMSLILPTVFIAVIVYTLMLASLKGRTSKIDWLQITFKTLLTAIALGIVIMMTADMRRAMLNISGVTLGFLIGLLFFNLFCQKKINDEDLEEDVEEDDDWTAPGI